MPMGVRISAETEAKIVALYADHGIATRHICERLGLKPQAVCNVLKRHGIKPDSRRQANPYGGAAIIYRL